MERNSAVPQTPAGGGEVKKVILAEKFAEIREYWRPTVVGALNGQHVKLAKFQGEFVWHHHADEDELSSACGAGSGSSSARMSRRSGRASS